MDRLGVSEYKDMVAEKVSKGNQQKIQLIAALIHNPELIVLDEPFSGLDPINTEMMSTLISELVDEKKYIVYGHTNLAVRTAQDISALAKECGMSVITQHADEVEFSIIGDDMADAFLSRLVGAGIYPIKYEIREPSLHEIFIEKAGE